MDQNLPSSENNEDSTNSYETNIGLSALFTQDRDMRSANSISEGMIGAISPHLSSGGFSNGSPTISTENASKSLSKGITQLNDQEWHLELDDITLRKPELDMLVLQFLVVDGYQAAALDFAKEVNWPFPASISSINERKEIRAAIFHGDIKLAIEKINDLIPELLDQDENLLFELLRLQLIELIRDSFSAPDNFSKIEECIEFASKNLAPRASKNNTFAKDLEKTIALLCFPSNSISPIFASQLDLDLRRQVADYVNESVILLYGDSGRSKLSTLIRLWYWGEDNLKKKDVKFTPLKIG